MSTKIITTLGPASGNAEVLQYFKEHSVEIARLNGSHGIIEEHIRLAKLAINAGLDLMLDLPGPKIRLGEINDKSLAVQAGEQVFIEKEKRNKGESNIDKENNLKILPCQFPIEKSTNINDIVYIDDGKLQFRVLNVETHRIQAEALNSGPVKSHKGVNLPCKFHEDIINLGSNPNLTKTKLSGLDVNRIPPIQNCIPVGSDPGSFSLPVISFMHVTNYRV